MSKKTHVKMTNIALGKKYQPALDMLEGLAVGLMPEDVISRIPEDLLPSLKEISTAKISAKLSIGRGLSFEEAFAGMMYVVFATNNFVRSVLRPDLSYSEALAKGSFFLTLMAAKENFVGLTPDEVAGVTAAGMVDIVYFPDLGYTFETAGMGADRGWGNRKRVKTINVSTLTSVVLASLGKISMKHGSYGNTTRVGSTDVPVRFGANINLTDEEIMRVLVETGYWYNDAHSVKTLHYLSHLLMVETINHVVGPMTPPVGKDTVLYKVMGVNHNVHPSIIAKAYAILHQRGFVNLGGVIILGGVKETPRVHQLEDEVWFKEQSYLDEVAAGATVVSMAAGETYLGTDVLVNGTAFGLRFDEEKLKVPNEVPLLMRANEQALTRGPLAEYLACNVALALATEDVSRGGFRQDRLQAYFHLALAAIEDGHAMNKLDDYIRATGGKRAHWS